MRVLVGHAHRGQEPASVGSYAEPFAEPNADAESEVSGKFELGTDLALARRVDALERRVKELEWRNVARWRWLKTLLGLPWRPQDGCEHGGAFNTVGDEIRCADCGLAL